MASIRKEILIAVDPGDAWAALRDFGAVHERLARGFVVDTQLEGDTRVVTFADGAVVREPLVTLDEEARRLVWTAEGGQATHYNAAAQVFDDGQGRTRFVWIADLLPDELAGPIGELMDQGLRAIKQTLEFDAAGA